MHSKSHEFSLSVLYICLKNISTILIFIYFALRFNTWWIALFSILFQSTIRSVTSDDKDVPIEASNFLSCYCCGELLYVSDIENAVHTDMKSNRWRRINVNGKWINLCPHCVDQYVKVSTKKEE